MNFQPDLNLIARVSEGLRDILGDDFDPETFWDTLDGETDVADILSHLVIRREEAKGDAQAAKEVVDRFGARKKRRESAAAAIAKVIGDVLDATSETKVKLPVATISRTKGRTSLRISDESAIPSQLTVTKVEPDKAAIKKALEAGESIPGAELVTGDAGVSVRVV